MINYTVLWRKEVVSRLAEIWSTYHCRDDIKNAGDRIDAELAVDAHLKGIVPGLPERSITCGPLTA